MTIEEAIKHCEEKSCGNDECATEHKQLAEWLTELKNKSWQKGHPEKDGQCLVTVMHTGRNGDKWLEIKILTWNSYYNVWDQEDGDDYECDPDDVPYWMPLPNKPKID